MSQRNQWRGAGNKQVAKEAIGFSKLRSRYIMRPLAALYYPQRDHVIRAVLEQEPVMHWTRSLLALSLLLLVSTCISAGPPTQPQISPASEDAAVRTIELPSGGHPAFYSPPRTTETGGTFSLSGSAITITGGLPIIFISGNKAEQISAFVTVAGRELLLDARGNEEVSKQLSYHAIIRHGGAGERRVDLSGRLEFMAPKPADGPADLLARVPVVFVDSVRFYLVQPGR